ncbi:MAG: hypothetical protein IPP41_01840 [Rhodocyclaceae bacterium]|nr:hypothetical protein [Rhodocyclaceae bacterium]
MSLLMDALKKAEAAKRKGADDSAPAGSGANASIFGELTLEPIATDSPPSESDIPLASTADQAIGEGSTSPAHLPELPANLGGLDAEFVAHHEAQKAAATPIRSNTVAKVTPPSPAVPTPATASQLAAKSKSSAKDSETKADREAARNMFDAKAAAAPARNRSFAYAIGIFTTLVALGIVGYFWWQLQPKTGFPSSGGVPARAAAPVPPPASPTATNPAPALAGAVATPSGQPGAAPAVGQSPDNAAPAVPAPTAPASAPTKASAKKKLADAAAENESEDGIRLVRVTKSPLQINPALTKGFDNFNRGNFAAAKIEYESILKVEPQNLEALHGLAAIAVREQRWNVADHFYERILVADPKDAVALSAMINLHGQNNPGAAESRLKGIVSEQPESAAAQFALGNLYAAQQRWADAQQAYFKAYSADAESPDILYNLAVSLEHMNQAKLAYQYYSLALEAAKRRPAGFDLTVAGARAAALRP